MQEVLAQIQTVVRGMWKHRWLGVLVAWLVALAGTITVLRIPDQYEASARIHVDTLSILKPLMAGLAVQPDIDQQIGMLSRTLISRPNVEKLVRMADLDLNNTSKSQQAASIDSLMTKLKIAGTGRDNLYVLSYRDQDPDRAKRAVQSLVTIFVESGLGASRNDAAAAKAFIVEQIKSYQTKLEEAEARLKEFRLRNIDLQFGEGRDTAARLGEMSGQLEKARLELREAENARDAAKQALASEKAQASNLSTQSLLQESAISVATPEIDARLDAQRRQLDNLLQRFTEAHPDVTSARRLVKDLEEQRRKEVQALRKTAMAAPPTVVVGAGGGSLAAQELNRMVAMSEVQVAALRARVGEYSARYSQVRESLKTAPRLEAEAAQLNRDYAIHKKNYEDLVTRRESAAMTGNLEEASAMADFRLIDPPRVSQKPVWPNRLVLLPLALVGALAAGLFAAFAGGQLRPVFFHAGDLRAKLDLPILGTISAVMGDADTRRRRNDRLRFIVASGGLVLLFAAGMSAMSILVGR